MDGRRWSAHEAGAFFGVDRDLKVGAKVQLPPSLELPKDVPTVLALVGSCSECVKETVWASIRELVDSGTRVIYVYDSADAKVVALRIGVEAAEWPKRVLHDEGGSLHAKLNAWFTPRLYAIDSESKILALQESPAALERFAEAWRGR